MSKKEQKPKLTDPWRSLHGAVWLIGLAILAWRGWWWPGILVLVAVSMVIEALLHRYVPEAFEKGEQTASPQPIPAGSGASSKATEIAEHPLGNLPSNCPRCGGPIRGHEVNWSGAQTADCPYCGARLPLEKG